jgi:prenylcysteine oxidase/farnesylcysteine lyase
MFECEMANLAVVGAGIGGCSAAYFAHKCLPGVNVTIYDSQDRIGGRILTYNAAGVTLELGAAFFNGFNRTLLGIVKAERLKMTPVAERMDFAVWNGSEFVFRSNKQSFATSLKLLAKYKLSLARTFLLLRKVRGQVAKLYQEELKNPADIGELFESTCLDKWHKKPFFEALIERGISQAFIDEIVTPITRVIYSQNADLGGFAGISSLIGVYSGATYSLAEGNSTLPVHLAEASNATIKLGQKVGMIEKTPKGTYRVYTEEDMAVFDSVIIATPLELADIKFDGLSMHGWEPQPYQAVYRRVMRGVFDPNYFGLKNSADPPAIVLTTKDADPITQYSIQKVSDDESLVTISSPEPLNYNVFNGVFKNGEVSVLEHCWKAAYPVFKLVTKLPLTRIDKRLMYVSAIEPSVSSMETSALSALNAVLMLGEE